ncbi:DUF2357 domain-containing protein [Opitutales bacterium]|nr:DUF2357 domain-containing protein [Opitutales bacterium]
MITKEECFIPCLSKTGEEVAQIILIPFKDAKNDFTSPIVEISDSDASEFGETRTQLRESERYEYEVRPISEYSDLRLRCSLSKRRKSLDHKKKISANDAGILETRSFCGTLMLEVVEGEVDANKESVATGLVEVRSIKMNYRTQYRGMLFRISDEIAGLLADARSSTKSSYLSSFKERKEDRGWLQIQLELLRVMLDSSDFNASVHRILSYPHERLVSEIESRATNRPIRWSSSATRQLVSGNPRRKVPKDHFFRTKFGIESVAETINLVQNSRDLDTPENRFIKFVLQEFSSFLKHSETVFEKEKGWHASEALSHRLSVKVDSWLGHSFFRAIRQLRILPLGSPVLQRKAGYREVLRSWLRFRTTAELSWQGGKEVFHAGQRDVASLYEYWLFFVLLDWFSNKFGNGERPPIEDLVEGLDENSPNLRLRKRFELGPFRGLYSGKSRVLNARFSFNRRFPKSEERQLGGSWTSPLHPDYTISFWPLDFSEEQAEKSEVIVHLHFDAKYRVNNVGKLFALEENSHKDDEGNYKKQDLLKMHAYKDAIKRSHGAYILYPGDSKKRFQGFHEILPGLGAFGVTPDMSGKAKGFDSLEKFLDEVLDHLSNRTTALERFNYHISESYSTLEDPVEYGSLKLPEIDVFGKDFRAVPPAEHFVAIGWYNNKEQLDWIYKNGIANLRLGKRYGSWHVQPEISATRHLLLRTFKGEVAPGLWKLKKPGFKVYTENDLKKTGYPGPANGEIYAVFEIEPDQEWKDEEWDGEEIMNVIESYESRIKHRLVNNLGRTSPFVRILPLSDLLKSRKAYLP